MSLASTPKATVLDASSLGGGGGRAPLNRSFVRPQQEKKIPSALSHPAPALTLATLFRSPRLPSTVIIAGAVCSVLPDLDVLFLRFGIAYDSMFGHRGITHSLPFAIVLGGAVAFALRHRVASSPLASWLYLSAATASHGFFDAFTNGGRGVAFFAPFSNSRYFFPFRPIQVSPLSIGRFLSDRGIVILASEAAWVWAPSLAFALFVMVVQRVLSAGRA